MIGDAVSAERVAPTLGALVRNLGLDRRKRYVEWQGVLCTVERATIDCPGCTDHGGHGERHGPYGCRECGHTGKRRITFPEPVTVDGQLVEIPNAEVRGATPTGGASLSTAGLAGETGGRDEI